MAGDIWQWQDEGRMWQVAGGSWQIEGGNRHVAQLSGGLWFPAGKEQKIMREQGREGEKEDDNTEYSMYDK